MALCRCPRSAGTTLQPAHCVARVLVWVVLSQTQEPRVDSPSAACEDLNDGCGGQDKARRRKLTSPNKGTYAAIVFADRQLYRPAHHRFKLTARLRWAMHPGGPTSTSSRPAAAGVLGSSARSSSSVPADP